MQAQELIREFTYNSVKLADPNPAFNLTQVRDFFATVYPEIINADIEGPEVVGNKNLYKFRRAVGTKGSDIVSFCAQLEPLLIGKHQIAQRELLKLTPPNTPRGSLVAAMDKLGWRRHKVRLHYERSAGYVFNKIEKTVPAMVADLAALENIGWFNSEGRTASFIRITSEFVTDQPGFILADVHIARIKVLHAQHCSRTLELAA